MATRPKATQLSPADHTESKLCQYTAGRWVKKIVDGQTTIFHKDFTGKLMVQGDGQEKFTKLSMNTTLAMVVVKDKQKANEKHNDETFKVLGIIFFN